MTRLDLKLYFYLRSKLITLLNFRCSQLDLYIPKIGLIMMHAGSKSPPMLYAASKLIIPFRVILLYIHQHCHPS